MSQWKVNDDWVFHTFGGVVLLQFGSETPRLAAYDRVHLRIVIRTTAENGYANSGLFQIDRLTLERGSDDKLKQLNQPVTAAHRGAATNPFDRPPDRVLVFGYSGHIRCKHRCVIMRAQQFSPHTKLDAKKQLASQLFGSLYLPDRGRRGETAAARSERFANTGDFPTSSK